MAHFLKGSLLISAVAGKHSTSTSLRLFSLMLLRRAFSDCCHAMLEHIIANDLPERTG
jgi:hypothetical protein